MQSHQLFLALLLAGTTSASYGVPLRRRDNVTTPAIDPVPVLNQYIIEFAKESSEFHLNRDLC
jgi:hypothetical protein